VAFARQDFTANTAHFACEAPTGDFGGLKLGPYRFLVRGGVEGKIQKLASILHKKAPAFEGWSFFECPSQTLKFSGSTGQRDKSGV
jgi:hypothetical protein